MSRYLYSIMVVDWVFYTLLVSTLQHDRNLYSLRYVSARTETDWERICLFVHLFNLYTALSSPWGAQGS